MNTHTHTHPSLSLVKHDALPQPSARRWLKFTLRSFSFLGGGGELRLHSCAPRANGPKGHGSATLTAMPYLFSLLPQLPPRQREGQRSSSKLRLTIWNVLQPLNQPVNSQFWFVSDSTHLFIYLCYCNDTNTQAHRNISYITLHSSEIQMLRTAVCYCE